LELGCGTGRLLVPLARAGLRMAGIDLSAPMLARAVTRARRLVRSRRPLIARGDIRRLPFRAATFGAVMAPYGLLQSLVKDADLDAALADVRRVLARGGLLGIDLVPDLEKWDEYTRQVSLRGRLAAGATVTLVETVRQDRRRRLTIFDEEFIERRRGRSTRHRFTLTFRTLAFADVLSRIEDAGFRVEATAGDYRGGPWTTGSDVWIVHARRR
jgi:ubiquinone/menaquinone biosynthesis C-methylase UbiE